MEYYPGRSINLGEVSIHAKICTDRDSSHLDLLRLAVGGGVTNLNRIKARQLKYVLEDFVGNPVETLCLDVKKSNDIESVNHTGKHCFTIKTDEYITNEGYVLEDIEGSRINTVTLGDIERAIFLIQMPLDSRCKMDRFCRAWLDPQGILHTVTHAGLRVNEINEDFFENPINGMERLPGVMGYRTIQYRDSNDRKLLTIGCETFTESDLLIIFRKLLEVDKERQKGKTENCHGK